MNSRVSELLKDAQQLSHQDLAELVHELLHALDASDHGDGFTDLAGAKSAWSSEALRRLEEIEDGSVQSVDGRSSFDLARKQLAARRR